uniref:Uncharacterized protein n=1 Tax=Anopheles christyi TaxID=43041 RepID=A0A9I3A6I5_9DIPT
KNASTWERRLSVYWAYLKLVRLFHENYSESTNINREEAEALDIVNEANKQLLCMVHEYREATNRSRKLIDAAHMERMIKFNIQDASEIKIHIWYIMCRLECYLTNMRKHLRQLSLNGSNGARNGKPLNLMICKRCPYCSKSNKQCKPLKKKHRQQQQQEQQQQQQPKKHNRAGHKLDQTKLSKQQQQQQQQEQHQQQPSTQPKGRKGTRTPNNHARNKQQG